MLSNLQKFAGSLLSTSRIAEKYAPITMRHSMPIAFKAAPSAKQLSTVNCARSMTCAIAVGINVHSFIHTKPVTSSILTYPPTSDTVQFNLRFAFSAAGAAESSAGLLRLLTVSAASAVLVGPAITLVLMHLSIFLQKQHYTESELAFIRCFTYNADICPVASVCRVPEADHCEFFGCT